MAGELTSARTHVADALAGVGVKVYSLPTENPSPPCLQVGPAAEWITRQRLAGGKVNVALNVRVTVPVVGGNAEALANLEDLVWAVTRLVPIVGAINAPTKETSNQVEVYVVDLPTMVTVSE